MYNSCCRPCRSCSQESMTLGARFDGRETEPDCRGAWKDAAVALMDLRPRPTHPLKIAAIELGKVHDGYLFQRLNGQSDAVGSKDLRQFAEDVATVQRR